ncbi:malectin domain-containing carbohydrate-binding protein [Haladaptatus salinisoli]|uniref:malectin domain-containing carbohydrate-binding protein n=1 Tax=Haladaptatus salinisoli TaxID=2884876 RepID=UPI001D0AFAEB|nr:malectin domain-containing carbohydrate-binding protein [Haladaptatus salinisoli]
MSGTSSTASSGFVQGILIGGGVVFFVAGMVILGGIPGGIFGPSAGGVDNRTTTVSTTTQSMQTSTSAAPTSEATTSKQRTTEPSKTTRTTATTTTTTTTSQSRKTVLYRVNVGGPRLSMVGGPDWTRDTENRPSRFGNARRSGSHTNSTNDAISMTNAVPAGTPERVFQSRRYDADNPGTASDDTEMQYRFPVEQGTYEVRIYLAETYFDHSGWNDYQENGPRTFDIQVEGRVVLNDYDMYAELGPDRGTVKSYTVTVRDGALNVRFLHEQEDPMISGIEVVRVDGNRQNDRSENGWLGAGNGEKNGKEERDEKGGNDERDDSRRGDVLFGSTPADLLAPSGGRNGI